MYSAANRHYSLIVAPLAVMNINLAAPQLRNRRSSHSPRQHPLPLLRQSRPCLKLRPVRARCLVHPSGPPDLGCGAGPWPDDGVQAGGVNGLGPDGELAANDILLELGGHAVGGLVGVDELPVLSWVAPVEEGVVVLEGGSVVEVEELATAAVKILLPSVTIRLNALNPCKRKKKEANTYVEIIAAVNDFISKLGQLLDCTSAKPRLRNNILAQRGVPVQNHFLPHHRHQSQLADFAVRVVQELLEQWLQHTLVVCFQCRVEQRVVRPVLVAAGVEIGRVGRQARQQIFKQRVEELFDVGIVQLEGSAGRLGAVPLPRVHAIGIAEAGIRLFNSNMAWHIDFDNDLNTSVHAVLLYTGQITGRVAQSLVVGALLSQ